MVLHLLAPHVCPACNGPHRETAPVDLAAQLRPYFGTYTPSKFPPADVDTGYYLETGIVTTWSLDGTTGTYSLTLNRTGHWMVGVTLDFSVSYNAGGSPSYHTHTLTGPIAATVQKNGPSADGINGQDMGFGRVIHGVYSSGTVQTWRQSSSWRQSGNVVSPSKIWAHFVPSATYPQ